MTDREAAPESSAAERAIIQDVTEARATPETTEGPYYKAGSPEKKRLYEDGVPGEKLTLKGHVFDANGARVQGARLDFWQANGNGRYDNVGYVLRGHQFASKSGGYVVHTVVPGGYTGRTPHIHVKVSSPDGRLTLTTQVFMPGLASNKTDPIFRDDLLVEISETPRGKSATFDFILNLH